MILAADVGGTFTDLVLVDGDSITTAKVPTTPDQSVGIASGAARLADGRSVELFLHGTTVATNALLERAGARTVLITDEGFEDIVEIGRQDRPSLYDSFDDRPVPLVERVDRIGVGASIADLACDLDGVGAVAISTINGHLEEVREAEIERQIIGMGFDGPISRSSLVAPEFREFERTSTTVLNAYLGPRTSNYLSRLDEALVGSGLVDRIAVMKSSGGLTSTQDAASHPASILLSGPAGGVIATAAFARAHVHDRVVSFDMGGTSTDVCRIEFGQFDVSYERTIDGYVCRLPSAGVHTVGAGGGSIAWIDAAGSLRVGPQSAGAVPGPACYGRGGTAPTVSDANVVLGRIAPDASLGGSLTIQKGLAVDAVQSLGSQLGLSVEATALGIVTIAEEVMAQAVRKVSIDEGSDPRGAFLYAFGGAGGLHASAVARSLGMAGVVVPPHGGVFSAIGLLLAPPRADAAVSVLGSPTNAATLLSAASVAVERATKQLGDAGQSVVDTQCIADIRYLGQSHEIGISFASEDSIAEIAQRFHSAHRQRNGFARPDDPIEAVTVRAAAFGTAALEIGSLTGKSFAAGKPASNRPVLFSDVAIDTTVHTRESLPVGSSVDGPAIIQEAEATTVIGPGETARVLPTGAIEVTW